MMTQKRAEIFLIYVIVADILNWSYHIRVKHLALYLLCWKKEIME